MENLKKFKIKQLQVSKAKKMFHVEHGVRVV